MENPILTLYFLSKKGGGSLLESKFKKILIEDLKCRFTGCIVLHNDATLIQGFPDLLVLFRDKWAALEVKKDKNSSFQPNQEYYLNLLDAMGYASAVWPEIKEEVLDELEIFFQ